VVKSVCFASLRAEFWPVTLLLESISLGTRVAVIYGDYFFAQFFTSGSMLILEMILGYM